MLMEDLTLPNLKEILMRKSILSFSVAAALAIPAAVGAQQAAPAATPPPPPLTGNAGLFSQYIFRGLTQTAGRAAFQGGADYAHSSGVYMGTWLSNVSWLADAGAYKESSLEWDFYGGYKGSITGDLGYDVGLLKYYYPGQRLGTTADTLEAYGGLTWKWISAKFSYSLTDKTFGVLNSSGTYYLDITATYPMTDTLSLVGHYGITRFKGTNAGVTNSSQASYDDWKFGVSYSLPQAWTVGAYYTGTKMDATQNAFYTINGRKLGADTITASLQKTF